MPVPQKIRCRVEQILPHGNGVYSLDLIPERPFPRYLPGQFLHLALDPYDPSLCWPESRVFSIASSSQNREKLRISYSVRGKFTARMEAELKAGTSVWLKLPYGDFFIQSQGPVVLFAGGTGITAFSAFLEGLDGNFPHPVALFYGARNRELLLYRAMLDAQALAHPLLKVWYFLERGDLVAENEISGRLSVEAALQRIERTPANSYYLSGPPAMLQTIRQDLLSQAAAPASIRVDAWE
jgi:ferredoxin-NADP reductase